MAPSRAVHSLLDSGPVGFLVDRCPVRPGIQVRSGTTSVHPATARTIAGGLHADGPDETFVTVAPPRATEVSGSEPTLGVSDALERAEADHDDRLTVIVQLRTNPDAPRWLQVHDVEWRFPRTLEVTVSTEDWEPSTPSFDEREQLQTADELVATGVWTLSPRPRWSPSRAVLSLE